MWDTYVCIILIYRMNCMMDAPFACACMYTHEQRMAQTQIYGRHLLACRLHRTCMPSTSHVHAVYIARACRLHRTCMSTRAFHGTSPRALMTKHRICVYVTDTHINMQIYTYAYPTNYACSKAHRQTPRRGHTRVHVRVDTYRT